MPEREYGFPPLGPATGNVDNSVCAGSERIFSRISAPLTASTIPARPAMSKIADETVLLDSIVGSLRYSFRISSGVLPPPPPCIAPPAAGCGAASGGGSPLPSPNPDPSPVGVDEGVSLEPGCTLCWCWTPCPQRFVSQEGLRAGWDELDVLPEVIHPHVVLAAIAITSPTPMSALPIPWINGPGSHPLGLAGASPCSVLGTSVTRCPLGSTRDSGLPPT